MHVLYIREISQSNSRVEAAVRSLGYSLDSTDLSDDTIDLHRLDLYRVIVVDTVSLGQAARQILRALRDFNTRIPALVLHNGRKCESPINHHLYLHEIISASETMLRNRIAEANGLWQNCAEAPITIGPIAIYTQSRMARTSSRRLTNSRVSLCILLCLATHFEYGATTRVIHDWLYPEVGTLDQLDHIPRYVYRLRKEMAYAVGDTVQVVRRRGVYKLVVRAC